MPNWVNNQLSVEGDVETLNEFEALMATPYERTTYDWRFSREVTHKVSGNFLLWNAIRPIDLEAYQADHDKFAKEFEATGLIPEPDIKSVEAILQGFATGNDWYNWNIRNWGTKWDIQGAELKRETVDGVTALIYTFESAWSPPIPAITNLAKMFPTLKFAMSGLETACEFAYLALWSEGESVSEIELPITHDLIVHFQGDCWACSTDTGAITDSEFAEAQKLYGCLESRVNDLALGFDNE